MKFRKYRKNINTKQPIFNQLNRKQYDLRMIKPMQWRQKMLQKAVELFRKKYPAITEHKEGENNVQTA